MDNGIGSSRFIGRRSRTSRLLLGTVTSIIYLAGHAHNHQRGPSTRLTTLSRGGCSTYQFHGEDLDMPNCPKCDKPVYFAERKTSLGKDWHGSCLRCEKCNKTLTPGSHSEHEGKPYCNHPCYAALFGPGGFGRGGAESYVYKK